MSKIVGEGEKKLENIFEVAKNNAPAVIFLDDLHIIGNKKDNNSNNSTIIATLVAEIDKIDIYSKVMVIASTN